MENIDRTSAIRYKSPIYLTSTHINRRHAGLDPAIRLFTPSLRRNGKKGYLLVH